jgi:hypothetical protein
LASALNGAYAGSSDTFNSSNYYLPNNLIHPGIINNGQVGIGAALQSVYQLRVASNAGDNSRATQAARNLCSGSAFDPCALSPSDTAPFNPMCIARACIAAGYSADAGLLPSSIGMNYWNALYGHPSTWAEVQGNITWWKNTADQVAGYTADSATQVNAIKNVYGVDVKWPKKGCNYNGVFMYRYLGNPAGIGLFPATGCTTHFLGRYILKNGIPATFQAAGTDQTPAGGFPLENQRLVTTFFTEVGGTYQFLINSSSTTRIMINDINATFPPGQQSVTPITRLAPNKSYPLTFDIINTTNGILCVLGVSINGGAWAQIPASQLFMPVDRREPMIEMAFNKLPVESPSEGRILQTDTNGIFANLFRWRAPIGTLNGRRCMLINNIGATYNHNNLTQGIRFCAMKSFTLMVQIDSVTIGAGITPTLVGFFNPAGTNPLGPVHQRAANINDSATTRQDDFEITPRTDTIYPWAFNQGPKTSAFMANIMSGVVGKYTQGQWTHIAFVWNDDFAGYTMYTTSGTNNSPTTTVVSAFCPPYSPTLIMENILIGAHGIDKNGWSGGIAWFRAFDYRLTQEQVLIDFKDQWADI